MRFLKSIVKTFGTILFPNISSLCYNLINTTKERMLNVEVKSLFKPREQKSKFTEIPIEQVVANPHQPRKSFSQDTLAELCDSIKQYGLIQPITVRRGTYSKYELIAGERRLL